MKSCCARYTLSLLAPSRSRSTLTASKFNTRTFASSRMIMAAPGQYAQIQSEQPGDEADDVLFNSLYGVRTVELNRPKKLNSLNGSMARKILPRLREWEKSQMANVVLLTGAGPKALCAGGDVAALAEQNRTIEGQKKSTDYFELEYQLDHLIATYSKPYIAMMDGITMGGGVGLSVHAPFRIATERTVFAMPETTIGFFPDVGGGFFLPRLDGEIGTYLALTSEQLHGVQAYYAGIASHYLDSSVLAALTTRLSELVFKDFASNRERLNIINATINEFTGELPSPDSYEKSKNGNITGSLRQAIDRAFKFDTIEQILEALESETHSNDTRIAEWAKATAQTMSLRSPTSLKVTLKQLRLGKQWDIETAFKREHVMAARFMAHPDFIEGVEAKLVRRSKEKPNWQPSTLSEVSEKDVNDFFTLPTGQDEMRFLEPVANSLPSYKDYPFANFALPRERVIEQIVQTTGAKGARAVLAEILKQWNGKQGVKEKVYDVLERNTTTENSAVVWQGREKANL